MDLEWLKSVVEDDDMGLLNIKYKNSAPNADEHLIAKFNEINDFITSHNYEPKADMANVPEFMLYQRLNAIRNNPEHCQALASLDKHKLLTSEASQVEINSSLEEKEISSMEDIFSDDSLGLLDDGADSIFEMRHVPKTIDMPTKVAKRKRCKDFEQYKHLFKACHEDLKNGERETHKFTGEQQIQKGQFFILHGVICYISDIGKREKKKKKVNARLHLIFENGTESDMLLRSLATELYKDESGRRILLNSDKALDSMNSIKEEDYATGYIYVLQSLSNNLEIQEINNLYKIGYSTTSIEKRIANAKNEPTYLKAPVKLIAGYQCFNMNAQKFENLLHTFFGNSCLNIEITDNNGEIHKPREWFIAPLEAIELVIQLLINEEIIHYRYDAIKEEVVER